MPIVGKKRINTMAKANPFYSNVVCTKFCGGKRALWHAHYKVLPSLSLNGVCGAGNTADNAIEDLAKQTRFLKRRESFGKVL
jgi:hypothetical protein